jgi:hypothetical protein
VSLQSSVTKFRNRLIGDTVRCAARDSAFYNSLYAGLNLDDFDCVDDLASLPTVDKKALSAAGKEALCMAGAGEIIALQNTSGTTGLPLWLYRCEAERSFIEAFFGEWWSRESENQEDTPLVLELMSDRHGVPTAVPARVFPLSLRLMDRSSLLRTVQFLRSSFSIPGAQDRISVLSGAHDDILMLTNHLIEQSIDPKRECAVRRLTPIGRYLTRRWRALLAEVWGARITDRYSLAETFGGATWSSELDGYVFDPYLVPEVLAFDGNNPVMEGVGRLHLTSLRPFSILQPFIRYRTGDVFEVIRKFETPVFRYLGREVHALFHPHKRGLMLAHGLAVLEALDPHAELNRDEYPAELGVTDRSAAGWPRSRGEVKSTGRGFTVRIEVETRCAMALFPDQAQALRSKILADFLLASPALQHCVHDGEAVVDISFAPAGTLCELERNSGFWRCQ